MARFFASLLHRLSVRRPLPAPGAGSAAWLALLGAALVQPMRSAPVFVTQPPNFTVREITEAKIPVQVRYNDFATLKWQIEVGGRILPAYINGSGANNVMTATVGWAQSVPLTDTGPYRIIVTDSSGTVSSETRTLTVAPAGPIITSQPASQSVLVGADVTFSVVATGLGTLRYEWRKNYYTLHGQTNSSLRLSNVQPSDAGDYEVAVYDDNGGRFSSLAKLTVNAASPPVIVAQPASQAVVLNSTVVFSVGVSGGAPFVYQWHRNGQALSGSTGASLVLPRVQTSQAGTYHVTVGNSLGTVRSADAILTVDVVPPVIVVAPVNQAATYGGSVTFTVSATGSQPLTYKWFRNGEELIYTNAPTLTLTGIGAGADGTYRVDVSNGSGTTSATAVLSIVNPARLINLSVLTELPTGEGFLLGFVTTGGPKPLLIRAAGPSLAMFGAATAHEDPRLELYAVAAKVGENDNWGDDPAPLLAVFDSVGAFRFAAANSLDAAIYAPSLAPGNNSVRISGGSAAGGMVLAELYEITSGSEATLAMPRLTNVSVLKSLRSGLSAGFVIGGVGARRLVIRAVGPGLSRFGVTDAVADPTLRITNDTGALIGSNDNWSVFNAATMTAAGGFSLAPNSRDAVFIGDFAPGNYVVQVSAAANSANATGLVLVEIYDSFPDVSR